MVAGIGGTVNVSGYSANVPGSLRAQSPSGKTFTLPLSTNVRGAADVQIPGASLTEAGRYTLVLSLNGAEAGSGFGFTVLPDRVDASRSAISVDRRTLTPDGRDTVVVTVSLADKFGNVLASRPVELIPSRSVDVRAQANVTDARGIITFAVRTSKPGPVTLRAFDLLSATTLDASVTLDASEFRGVGGYNDDGTLSGVRGQQMPAGYGYPYYPYGVSPYGYPMVMPMNPYNASLLAPAAYAQESFGVVTSFRVELSTTKPQTNDALTLKITAVDKLGNAVPTYNGLVTITSTDATATLPGSAVSENGEGQYQFRDRDLGTANMPLSVIFRRGGTQTIRVEDRSGPVPVSGELTLNVSGPDIIPDANRIVVTTPTKNGFVRAKQFNVEGKGPKFSNLIVKIIGGAADSFQGESKDDGTFSIPVELGNAQSYVLRVQSTPNGKFDSGDIPFQLKDTPPKIDSITFTPEKPQEGENVLAEVVSEPSAKVTIKFSGQETPLVESTAKPGSYQGAFEAPATGTYQPLFTVQDVAGNVTQQRGSLKVVPKGLPEVKNLKAEGRSNSVYLAWDAVEGSASYRVYVGKSASDFIAIDTKQSTTSAVIKDLDAGALYYFAVTGVNGERESPQGQVVTAKPIGSSLQVEPVKAGLHLTWMFPEELRLSAVVLEYGVDAQKLSERRLLNGALKDTVIRDLLPGVTYFVRLTPVSLEGTVIQDLAASGKGIVPEFDGYEPTPGENVQIDPNAVAPANEYHESAPGVTSVGLPRPVLYGSILLAIGATFALLRRRRFAQTERFLQAMERQYRS